MVRWQLAGCAALSATWRRALGTGLLAAAGIASATALDPSFGTGGRQYLGFDGYTGSGIARLAVQGDGKIVAAGNVGFTMTGLARLLGNGAVDTSFNGNGRIVDSPLFFMGSPPLALAIQPDQRILIGGRYASVIGQGTGNPGRESPYFARYGADGTADASFGSNGILEADSIYGAGEAREILLEGNGKFIGLSSAGVRRHNPDGSLDSAFGAPAIRIDAGALSADGRTVAFGTRMQPFPANTELAFVRYSTSGALEAAGYVDAGSFSYGLANGALQADGKVLVAGPSGTSGRVVRFLPSGDLDTTFATAGMFTAPGASIGALAVQADGKILVLVAPNEVWRLAADGVLDTTFGIGGRFGVPGAVDSVSLSSLAIQPDGLIVVGGSGRNGSDSALFFFARIDPAAPAQLTATPFSLAFGAQSMGTTSAPQSVTIGNPGGTARSIAITVSNAKFVQSNDCPASLAPSASCSVVVRFQATPTVGPLDQDLPESGALRIASDDAVGLYAVGLGATSERSLVTHYYRSILRREPESSGKTFWRGEASRVSLLRANVNEAWFAMAMSFYGSAEYAGFARDDTGYVTDLYNTFFARPPDAGGTAFWLSQLSAGLTRDALLASFMFSPEFAGFTQSIFGNTTARAEVDMVVDFYRGFLSRLPDGDGFNSWVQVLRTAQCQGGAAVNAAVDSISAAFLGSPEYSARARAAPQFVSDLYNAFMRRGADLQGQQYWVGQFATGATRDSMRRAFLQSPEFQQRVGAVVGQGCAN